MAAEVINPDAFLLRAPFDNPDADVILRSADGVDFRVHRIILAAASPFFQTMFGLPQGNTQPEVPVLPTAETAQVLDRLLRFWYPGAEPVSTELETLDNLREMLELLLLKYDMSFIVPRGKDRLRRYMEAHPVSVFSLACRHGWGDVATEAAWCSLKLPLRSLEGPPPAELKYTAADTFYILLQYHSQCSKAASAVAGLSWYTVGPDPWFVCTSCSSQSIKMGIDHRTLRQWFLMYLHDAEELLSSRPGYNVDDPKLMQNAVKKMADCAYCRRQGFEPLHSFIVNTFKPKLEAEISKVELKLVFN